MVDLLKLIILWSLVTVGPVALVLIYVFHNVEKVEKWAALFHRTASHFPRLFKRAKRRYIKHDLQGRINDFTKELGAVAPFLSEKKIKIDFVGSNVDRDAFIEHGKVVLRLREEDPEERNFVHGAHLFVSTTLVLKVKRYISKSQGEAIDLFVTTKLLEKENPAS